MKAILTDSKGFTQERAVASPPPNDLRVARHVGPFPSVYAPDSELGLLPSVVYEEVIFRLVGVQHKKLSSNYSNYNSFPPEWEDVAIYEEEPALPKTKAQPVEMSKAALAAPTIKEQFEAIEKAKNAEKMAQQIETVVGQFKATYDITPEIETAMVHLANTSVHPLGDEPMFDYLKRLYDIASLSSLEEQIVEQIADKPTLAAIDKLIAEKLKVEIQKKITDDHSNAFYNAFKFPPLKYPAYQTNVIPGYLSPPVYSTQIAPATGQLQQADYYPYELEKGEMGPAMEAPKVEPKKELPEPVETKPRLMKKA